MRSEDALRARRVTRCDVESNGCVSIHETYLKDLQFPAKKVTCRGRLSGRNLTMREEVRERLKTEGRKLFG
jgi:hypothetical protein